MLYRLAALLWVARTIGKEQTIELKFVEVVIPRHAYHFNTSIQ
jgi:hypothetical protein